ncbi:MULTISPECIES: phospholipase D family protein [unclassified Variovorax]|uniref:phospholipase D-like domain-containing protein n=1 Tax=unclassified Variovorax TaxID=663243 RepID=UPI00257807AD|nr:MULTISPECIES: phospholipase D family protein [unclassified Variovorax]MDM0086089.1 phospholipase D family protein [Variovorax sp. J22G40]MDM0145654.1 phospholipase D family protein [Variovorax sp. J2P1-31]
MALKLQRRLRAATLLAAVLLAGCASLPPPQPERFSAARTDVADTRLAQIALASGQDMPTGFSGFQLMPEGPTAFNARLALARAAQKTLDAQYYILQDDASGKQFLGALLDAARRGVRVRLLVDDFYTAGKDELFAALASQPNFELRLFNPLAVRSGPLGLRLALSLGDFRRFNRRMHNKLFVADNSLAITGGRNIADEYFMRSDVANFIDLDVLVSGPVVPELSDTFDDFWNSAQTRPIDNLMRVPADSEVTRGWLQARLAGAAPATTERETDVLGHAPIERQLHAGRLALIPGDGRAIADTPKKVAMDDPEASFADSVTQRTIAMLSGARSEVVMVSPYFIPGEEGIKLLQMAVDNDVQVIVLTNSLDATDESLVYAGYAKYRYRMLKAGVRVFELGGKLAPRQAGLGDFRSSSGRLHAKVALVDRRRIFLGSMNLDGRSARLNTEIGILVDSPALAEQFGKLMTLRSMGAYELRLRGDDGENVEWIEHDPDGSQKRITDEPGASWLGSLKDWLLLKLLPEDLL